jgi:hypothetical protein
MAKVLITGGTGLIGKQLSELLVAQGYEVGILSRRRNSNNKSITTYYWDIDKDEIDVEAVNSCDFIIHLAGANIGSKRWTEKRKQDIIDSRVKSIELILQNIGVNNSLRAFITSSAIGYYGAITSERVFTEADPPANDFLGKTCKLWEQGVDLFIDKGIRVVKIRTGIVLSDRGGALSSFIPLAKMGLGSAIGSGKQYMPWIHIDDLVEIYLAALENSELQGAYNAVAPEHTTNKDFARAISKTLKRPFWFPNVPAVVLKALYGEMSKMILNGSRVSSNKIETAGFKFQYSSLYHALESVLKK